MISFLNGYKRNCGLPLTFFVLLVLSINSFAQIISPRPTVKGYFGFNMVSPNPVVAATSYCDGYSITLRRHIYFYNNLQPQENPPGWTQPFPHSYRFNCAYVRTEVTDPSHPDYGVEYLIPNRPPYFTISWTDRSSSLNNNHAGNQPHNCSPSAGNPISIGLGEKTQTEEDYISPANSPLEFIRYYNSGYVQNQNVGSFGRGWSHTYDRRVIVGSLSQGINPYVVQWFWESQIWVPMTSNSPREELPMASVDYAYVVRPNGKSIYHTRNGDSWQTDYGVSSSLTLLPDDEVWLFVTADDVRELYDLSGRLVSIQNKFGQTKSLFYEYSSAEGGDDNSLTLDRVEDNEGNYLHFSYGSDTRLAQVTTSEGDTYEYTYSLSDNIYARLVRVTYPDLTTRVYQYDSSSGRRLTGITDERGILYSSWTYDTLGRAISSERAGGAGRVTLTNPSSGYFRPGYTGAGTSVVVTNPLGKQTTYRIAAQNGVPQIMRVEGHASANCAAANQAYTYDANGFMASKTDWQGNITTYIHNDRGQELSRTEASGTPQARTITTEWHSEFNLPIRIIEPERQTVMTYDANGRLLSREVVVVE